MTNHATSAPSARPGQADGVAAFLASLLYYLTPDDASATEADARATLAKWHAEGIEIPEGLTAAILAKFYRDHAPRDGGPDPDGRTDTNE